MKIVADENIPLVAELFSGYGDVVTLTGRKITAADVRDADILLVRSTTVVDAALLNHSKVRFVGTATTGTDHVDIEWLNTAGIFFADAKGANATAVAEYVICCIARLRQQGYLVNKKISAGVIGVGNVGSKVAAKLKLLGFDVLLNDPPRAQQSDFISTPLAEFQDLDLICVHTPLLKTGAFPTWHLIGKNFLKQQKKNAVLLNAGRGDVINSDDLEIFGAHLKWCFDVWEHEPHINLNILKNTAIATPHIAGYTIEAKLRGTLMLYQAAQKALQLPLTNAVKSAFPNFVFELAPCISWEEAVLQLYDPMNDTLQMQTRLLSSLEVVHDFDTLRKHYLKRHEFDVIMLNNTHSLRHRDKNLLTQLGFNLSRA